MRGAFEPKAPPLEDRWEAIRHVKEAGVPVGICVTPMLPLEDPDAFIQRLVAFQPDVVVTQDFQDNGGGFGASTGEKARRLLAERRWTNNDYWRCFERLRERMQVYEGEAGFFPPPRLEAKPRWSSANGSEQLVKGPTDLPTHLGLTIPNRSTARSPITELL